MLRKILAAAKGSDREIPGVSPARRLRRRLGSAGIEQIVAGYADGRSIKQLAVEFDTSGDAVLRLLREEGVETRKPCVISAEQSAEIVRRYEAGQSTYEIEEAVGVPRTTVTRTLQRAGVPLRSRGRPPRR